MSPEQSGMRDLHLLDLPREILLGVIHLLSPRDLFAFLSTCQSLQYDGILHTSARYWRTNTISKFRLPNYPVISEDGEHWKHLYRRMHTDAHLYHWGGNKGGLLSDDLEAKIAWPREIMDCPFSHAVADIVCGGYLTAVLTIIGQVWIKSPVGWHQCRFPPNIGPDRPYATIQQISATRFGVVGLAESGAMWYWYWNPSFEAQLIHYDVQMVKGGWGGCSAMRMSSHNEDSGILVWTSREGKKIEQPPVAIPMTSPYRPDYAGDVVNWVMMRDYVLFVTQPGRLWAWHIPSPATAATEVELPVELKHGDGTLQEEIADVCAWLERFALLMRDGQVLVGTSQMLENYIELGTPLEFEKIPALQNSGVIKIAFGDWHFHALHKDGTITSYGHEPEGCGALGLGSANPSLAIVSGDRAPRPECLTTGRRVHFEQEKKAWLWDIAMAYRKARPNMGWRGWLTDHDWYEASEWLEERLRTWARPGNEVMIAPGYDHGPRRHSDTEHDETPAYLAISVAACGWHSAALVLTADLKAKEIARRYAELRGSKAWAVLPRVQMLDGRISPGEGPLSRWSSPVGCPKPKEIEIVRW